MEPRLLPLDLVGVFTTILGALHFVLPAWLDYRATILGPARERKPPTAGPPTAGPPRPFRLWPTRYVATLGDRLGVVWVMNHAASYALVSIGLLDLFAGRWLAHDPVGRLVALWIAGWWLLRAANQLYFGRRAGDWGILAGFAALGALHLWVGIV